MRAPPPLGRAGRAYPPLLQLSSPRSNEVKGAVRRCQVSATSTGAHVLLHTFGEHQMMTGAATHESGAAQRCGILPTRSAVSVEAFRAQLLSTQQENRV